MNPFPFTDIRGEGNQHDIVQTVLIKGVPDTETILTCRQSPFIILKGSYPLRLQLQLTCMSFLFIWEASKPGQSVEPVNKWNVWKEAICPCQPGNITVISVPLLKGCLQDSRLQPEFGWRCRHSSISLNSLWLLVAKGKSSMHLKNGKILSKL